MKISITELEFKRSQLSPAAVREWQREMDAFLALPTPDFLPSGLPNVWMLRLYAQPLPTPQYAPKDMQERWGGKSPRAGAVPVNVVDVFCIEMMPYNVETQQPVLNGTDSMLGWLVEGDARPHIPTQEKTRPINDSFQLGQMVLNGLRKLFITNSFEPADGRLNPELKCLLPPFGTFRPCAIVVNDPVLLFDSFEMLIALYDRIGAFPKFNMITSPYKPVLEAPTPSTDPLMIVCGAIVRCGTCGKTGTERDGHYYLSRLLRCTGCQIIW